MRGNILFGGAAGQGPNFLTHLVGEALVKKGYYVFYSRDYQSLVRGGHNFNVLTFSDEPVYSNDKEIDILVALDDKTEEIHRKNLKKDGIFLEGNHPNVYFAGMLFKILNIEFEILENELKKFQEKFDENMKNATEGYENSTMTIQMPEISPKKLLFMNGNQGISEGAIEAGLDIYYAYPMTPATTILAELSQKQDQDDFMTLQLENEIAVANAAVGSAMTGAKTMVGTSGGGFDLMGETISLMGIAEIPVVIALIQRPGPGTGVATYTAQGDLNIARHTGHGEFPRLVVAPGDPKEAEELTTQAFYFSQRFKIPSIIVSDKHLGESFYSVAHEAKITASERDTELRRFNSYEVDENGSATEDPEIINKNIEKRKKKYQDIAKYAKEFEQYKNFGNPESQNVILSWGSTKGAILDAMQDLDCRFIQITYIEPFPEELANEIANKNLILVENNATGQLADLISEKTGLFISEENKILRYDARPFLCSELKKEIERRLR